MSVWLFEQPGFECSWWNLCTWQRQPISLLIIDQWARKRLLEGRILPTGYPLSRSDMLYTCTVNAASLEVYRAFFNSALNPLQGILWFCLPVYTKCTCRCWGGSSVPQTVTWFSATLSVVMCFIRWAQKCESARSKAEGRLRSVTTAAVLLERVKLFWWAGGQQL